MKNLIKYLSLFLLLVIFISCHSNSSKSDKNLDIETPENTFDWQGTYEGVFPAADAAGQYVLLAIDSTSYERACKFIDRPGIYVSMGKIKWNSAGDSLTLLADHEKFKVHDGMLIIGDFDLVKINDEVKLPRLFITQTLKDDKTGKNAVLEQYSVGQRELANFYFDGKTYKLKRDERNVQKMEYTDGRVKLFLQKLNSDTIQWDIHPVLIDDKDTCHFTVLSPVNDIYVATGTPQLIHSFDVLYLNGDEGSEVKLLNPEYKYCFTIPQIGASAKTAEYYNNGIVWSSGLHDATFSLGDEYYKFKEETPLTTKSHKKEMHPNKEK